jgi:dihydrofolate reductase
VNESTPVVEDLLSNVGATVMGRNMFGGYPGPWNPATPWNGWWGPNPPFHHPVFVITHHAREPLVLEGGTTFAFVTDGIASALALARRAAGSSGVALAGGASVARQFLVAGLVDELDLTLIPILLGAGERLFEGTGDDLHGLQLARVVVAPGVAHLKLARK